ncbi:MAG: MFS transporter [Deltaproteobacteria bacterium]|nr:MFS transporter [Deltaproteobacteria bacterium]
MNQESTAVPKTPGYAWVILIALYMATLSTTLNLFKLPPLMTTIQTSFGVDIVKAGKLMSVFNIMGFILAFPAGYILKRYGIKMTALIAVAASAIGPVIGALAKTFAILYVGRFIEGVGMGLIMVTAPLAISVWFPLTNRALPNGIWASSVGFGNLVMLLIAPSIAVLYKWESVWWSTAGFSVLSFIVLAILFRMPRQEEMDAGPAPQEENVPSFIGDMKDMGKGMANNGFWMIGIAFGCYNLVAMALVTFYPQFLEIVRGFSLTYDNGFLMHASFVTALILGIPIITGPLGGYISDRLGKRKIMILIPFILMAITFLFPFKVTGSLIILYVIILGIVNGPIAAVQLAAVPEVAKKPQYIGTGMAVAIFCQNIGMTLSGVVFPKIQVASGWEAAGYWMIPFCIIGIISTLLIKVR